MWYAAAEWHKLPLLPLPSSDSGGICGLLLQTCHSEDHPCAFLRPSTLWLTADSLLAKPGGLSSLEPQQQLEQQLYASPEELNGQPRTPRSDVFGLGLLFCVLFYGLNSITAHGQIEGARLGQVPSKVSWLQRLHGS